MKNFELNEPDSHLARSQRWIAIAVAEAIAVVASACGGGGGEPGITGMTGSLGPSRGSTVILTAPEARGSHCPTGGYKITAGVDLNFNSVLDGAEASSVQYVCNAVAGLQGQSGGAGSAGLSSLVQIMPEPPGENCPSGGSKILAGLDNNANNTLELAEIRTTGYVCNLAASTDGINGTNGFDSLVSIVAEASGMNCLYGGSKVSAGLDLNRNRILDNAEVSETSFICNNAPTPNLVWVNIVDDVVQAQANTGYLASSAAQVVVRLPSAPTLGDVIRVSGAGPGGWQIKQNSGQSIVTKSLPGVQIPAGQNWVPRESARVWRSVASSGDGTKLAAVDFGGQIYVSTDSGITWSAREFARYWHSVASSADGSKLVAVAVTDQIYTSSDFGANWIARDIVRNWRAVASSADGVKLVAIDVNGQIYTSADSGLSWSARDSARQWSTVASSVDGSALVAAEAGGRIYTSSDSGVTWTARDNNRFWLAVSSSADGVKLVAVEAGGQIYTSTDSGQSWTPRDSAREWVSVASSADGSKLVAAANGGRIYVSNNSGLNWTPRESSRNWYSVASSADGSKLVAADNLGQIYTAVGERTTLGIAGSLSGAQFDSVELQYVGDGLFLPLSYQSYSGGFVLQ